MKIETIVKRVRELKGDEYTVLSEDTFGSPKVRFLVRHEVCGHKWEVSASNFIYSGTRCPICYPVQTKKSQTHFIEEVKAKFGSEYTVIGRYVNTHVPILLRHETCGNEWSTTSPTDFLKSRPNTCPKCAHPSRRKTHSQFVREVKALADDYEVIGRYTTNKTKVQFRHIKCGHIWTTTPNLFLNGTRCPVCWRREHRSRGAKRVRLALQTYGFDFQEEYPFSGMVLERQLSFDFFIGSHDIAIEYDGEQHFRPKFGAGGEMDFQNTIRRDHFKNRFCSSKHIHLLRIPYTERDIETLLEGWLFKMDALEAV